jgi:hypothetical protein
MEHRDDYQSEAAALTAIAGKLGCSPDSLRVWVRQAQRDGGERPGQTTAEKTRIKELVPLFLEDTDLAPVPFVLEWLPFFFEEYVPVKWALVI